MRFMCDVYVNLLSLRLGDYIEDCLTYVEWQHKEDEKEGELKENTSDDERPGKNMILLCADGRNLASHLNNIHSLTEYEAVGFINPGGRSKQILKKKNIEGENLNKKDILVLMCGSNDIAGNEAEEALSNISDTLDNTKNTNVILVDLPTRYDLVNWSCVNRAVSRTNLCLKELDQKYSHATVVDVSKAETLPYSSRPTSQHPRETVVSKADS
ncbi:hypothetical protein J6590_031874 [Homalodisca vitripennis]|nr:hypothetical protein J6590_031874 [Homalodisca vitripennis]